MISKRRPVFICKKGKSFSVGKGQKTTNKIWRAGKGKKELEDGQTKRTVTRGRTK